MSGGDILRWRIVALAGVLLAVAACTGHYSPAPVIGGGQTAGGMTAKPGGAVTVRSGDTMYNIARRHGVSLRALIDANRISPPYRIFPGQSLTLPGVHPRAAGDRYVVRRGDTVYGIARDHGIEPGALVKANALPPPYKIAPGQKLVIPDETRTRLAMAAARKAPASALASAPQAVEPASVRMPARRVAASPPRVAPVALPPLPPRSVRDGFLWPVSGKVVARFGKHGKGLHNDGINIVARRGTPVRAVESGVVAYAGNELRGFGNLLLIKHAGGWISAYAHNDALLVHAGQRVERGQVISRVGNSGSVVRPQLHFELRRGNRAVDPEDYLGRRTVMLIPVSFAGGPPGPG